MTIYVPSWMLVFAVGIAPFVIGALTDRFSHDGFGIKAALAFTFSAAVCWTGLAVWLVMR